MILLVGSTGILGGQLARNLLNDGERVRALVRGESEATRSHQSLGAELISGDLKDRRSLDAALDGAWVVVTTATSALRGEPDTVETVDLVGNRDLIDAAKEAGIGQFVFVSSIGADPESSAPLLRAKAATETHLKESGLTYTILVPNFFLYVWAGMVVAAPAAQGRPITLVGDGERKHSFIAVRDVAAIAAAVVGHPSAENQTLWLGGPEAVSWRDVVAAFERARGKRLEVRTVPPGGAVPGLPDVMSGLLAAMASYYSPIDMTHVTQTYAVHLTSVDNFARETAGGARPAVKT